METKIAVEMLKSVLCDPEGNCCIRGSDGDRRVVDEALAMLANRGGGEPVAWGYPNTAITGARHALMMVRLEIPGDDQYGGKGWLPLYLRGGENEADQTVAALRAEDKNWLKRIPK